MTAEIPLQPVLRCGTCGKLAFPRESDANKYVKSRVRALRANGMLMSGETPVKWVPVRSYQCPAGNGWHVTSTPLPSLLPLTLPGMALGHVREEIMRAIAEQGPDLLFPTVSEFAQLYGLTEKHARERTRLLARDGWLTFDERRDRYVTTRMPLPAEFTPLLPVPPPGGGSVAETLLDAILRHPAGMRMPSLKTLAGHFRVYDDVVQQARLALRELGWLRVDGTTYLTSRPEPDEPENPT